LESVSCQDNHVLGEHVHILRMPIVRFLESPWIRGRYGRLILLGSLCLLLQQIPASYEIDFSGLRAPASLIHLHAGLLFAIALLSRDRMLFAGVTAIACLGWMARQWSTDGGSMPMLAWGGIAWMLTWAWTLACVHLIGWPAGGRLQRQGLLRFAVIGLLLFPAGLALVGASIIVVSGPTVALSTAFQMFFAKHFGVAVVALPLAAAWGERGRAATPPLRMPDAWLPLLLCGVLGLSFWAASLLRTASFGTPEASMVLMDYRFALLAVLGWCVLRLPAHYAMAMLSVSALLLVGATAGTAGYGSSVLGFVNLLHIALEVSVVVVAVLYLWVINRDRQELAERLTEETLRDPVTGLPNLKALRQRTWQSPKKRAEMAYLLLDQTDSLVTGFGLDTQAAAMNAVARRLEKVVDTYSVGTGQFALLPRDDDEGLWERVVALVEHTEIDAGGQALRLLPYLGVARLAERRSGRMEAALLAASHLAFDARQHGEVRPRYSEVGDALSRRSRRQQMQDATEALACLRNERVVLYFQPILRLRSDLSRPKAGDIHGEVLCRLRDEHGALIPPSRFMGPIEAAGRGAELDLAVLKALFRQLREHPGALPHCRQIAVNLTGQSLASISFQMELRALLADSPVPLSALCFEITETAAISSAVSASQMLADLRARGCRIAIDDFGTGMQSFARLKELPVDTIKIDGSFIRNVAARGKDYALVQASVAVAEAFGAETVAEFVDSAEIEACLRELGVQWVQGHLYAAPQPLRDVLVAAASVPHEFADVGREDARPLRSGF
jgi:EAL domain-containing protein (putative c-di-GMP-specific phosphodiesterase class I)/GGDEF domain-containing protein